MSDMILDTYPVDTEVNVRAASDYFDEHEKRFNTADRVTFAQELATAHDHFALPLSEKVAHYVNIAPRATITPAIKIRDYLTGGQATEELDMIVKEANGIPPEGVVALLETFDKCNGLYGAYNRLPNPFDSVFVNEKTAGIHDDSLVWTSATSDRLSKDKLQQWTENPSSREMMRLKFNGDLVEGISGPNGWEVFKSLPDPTKQVIARLVNENVVNGTVSPGRDSRSTSGEYTNAAVYGSMSSRLRKLID
jgi:hypothetical protein